jgi:hypothetical protein
LQNQRPQPLQKLRHLRQHQPLQLQLPLRLRLLQPRLPALPRHLLRQLHLKGAVLQPAHPAALNRPPALPLRPLPLRPAPRQPPHLLQVLGVPPLLRPHPVVPARLRPVLGRLAVSLQLPPADRDKNDKTVYAVEAEPILAERESKEEDVRTLLELARMVITCGSF